MKFKTALISAAVALGLMTSSASALDFKVQLGVLTCDVDGGWGWVVGSKREGSCVFVDSKGNISNYYLTVTKVGIDVGYTSAKTLVWAVFAPSNDNSGPLSGSYAGVNAEASIVAGLGANVLVGGLDNSFALQPISGQFQTGVNAALTVESLSLE